MICILIKFFFGFILVFPGVAACSSTTQSNYLFKWPWDDDVLSALLQKDNLAKELNRNSANGVVADAFEERWNKNLRTLVYLEFRVSPAISFSPVINTARKEINFTGWVFSGRRLEIKISRNRTTFCEITEVFGHAMTIDLSVFNSNEFPTSVKPCDLWRRESKNRKSHGTQF